MKPDDEPLKQALTGIAARNASVVGAPLVDFASRHPFSAFCHIGICPVASTDRESNRAGLGECPYDGLVASKAEAPMTSYILAIWAGVNVGFLLGAAWFAITSAK